MQRVMFAALVVLLTFPTHTAGQERPRPMPDGYFLPNGWRISPAGSSLDTPDLLLNLVATRDGRAIVGLHGGFNPHGLVVVDAARFETVQRIPLKSAWLGLTWNPAGDRLFVSGGNANGKEPSRAPIYVFRYAAGRLSETPVQTLEEELPPDRIFWSGLAHHPVSNVLYAANRGTTQAPGEVVAFDTTTGKPVGRVPVEVTPYDIEIEPDGSLLYVSNWSSDSISVIDTKRLAVVATIAVGDNPNDLLLAPDGRLFVACANDNAVLIVDTKTRRVTEKIATVLFPRAPEGSTPNALFLDREHMRLYVANADNNAVAVVSVATPGRSEVLGFIPSGWYPSALTERGSTLYIGNAKGSGSYSNVRGPHSPILDDGEGKGSVKSLQKGSVTRVNVANLESDIKAWTTAVYRNTPYKDELLARARSPQSPSIIPSDVGAGSPIKHVIYIIKENRTYDQLFGDFAQANGDPRLTIFGREVTPNHHALAEQYVLLDNLFCDGEVSVDGHSWSTAAYATDFNEKNWPASYGGHSRAEPAAAFIPGAGRLWDQARRKGLTYRSYGEYTAYDAQRKVMVAADGAEGLVGHVAPDYKKPGMRDTDNAAAFIAEFDEFERHYDDSDRAKRLPNLIVMSLPEDHTQGTQPGRPTPRAAVANNDRALAQIIARVSRSRYWPETTIFVIEDDAQDGSDHVDARRTVGLVVGPYVKRGVVDSTLYTTSSMLRTIELLLGLSPMSQFDAAAAPMYAAFDVKANPTAYQPLEPRIDTNELNLVTAWGAQRSLEMDFSDVDRTPMYELNEIVWRSVKGADSPMPPPVRAFFAAPSATSARSK